MLKERQQSILEAAIWEYIRTAHPVASQEIAGKLARGVSSATIRNEMQVLDEEGYLEQPHTSAGRVPTDKGYRFFVDHLRQCTILDKEEAREIKNTFRKDDIDEFIHSFSRTLASISGTFAAVGTFEEHMFYDNGLFEILDEPEFEEADSIRSFGKLVDLLDELVPEMLEKYGIKKEAIFIGNENPLKEAKNYAMTVSRWHHPRGFDGFFAMVGPRRANYQKHLGILRYLEENQR